MKMRIWWMPQVGCGATMYIPVENDIEGVKLLNVLACYDLFQLENNIKPDFANSGGVQIYNTSTNEWEDWEKETKDDYYDDIDDYFENDTNIQNFKSEIFGQLKR